ncbi:MAG TPA: hypothetical protein VH879_01830 [Gemmatimonadales bacterium]
MTTLACPACRAILVPDARYCHRCGRAVTSAGSGERTAWLMAWSLVALTLGGIVYFVAGKSSAAATPDMANVGSAPSGRAGGVGGGAPPDISQLTPRERFLRLHDRILTAAGQGDSATVTRFAPMALAAYGMLDRFDPDVRFHAGTIHVRLRQYPEALALADTIQAEANDHLFADLLRAEVAEARGDRTALQRSRRAFLAHYPEQIASGRPEYTEHRTLLEEFKREAQ